MSSNLDLVRATAVLCVFFAHLYSRVTQTHTLTAWHFGQMGVIIFFVHTACVLMQSLDRSARTLSGTALWTDFYIRRGFRIYPLAMLCVILSWFGLSLLKGPWTLFDLISNLTLTMNVTDAEIMWEGHWTLPIEVQMYVVLPPLFLLLRNRPVWTIFALWIVAVIAGLLQPTGRLNVMEYSPCFVAGVLAWHVSRSQRRQWPAYLWPVVFVATWAIWMISTRENREPYRWAFCLALGILIPRFHELTWKPLTRTAAVIAKYSYGIYLSHATVFAFALTFENPWLRWPIMAVLAALVPVLLFHLIEDPMIQVGKRVASWRPATVSWRPVAWLRS